MNEYPKYPSNMGLSEYVRSTLTAYERITKNDPEGKHPHHDGDCNIFVEGICTCGLLHILKSIGENPSDIYPAYDVEMSKHTKALASVPKEQ